MITSEGVDDIKMVVENYRPEEQTSEIRKAAWGRLFAGTPVDNRLHLHIDS